MPKTINKAGDKTPTPVVVKPAPPPPTPTPPPAPSPAKDLTVVYDKLKMLEYSATSELGPLTVADMKAIMGWETEKEYQARMVVEKPDSKPEHWLYGDVYHCLNTDGQKVRCWRNANNRGFDLSWCEDLIHTILQWQWAGPLTLPGETVNGETIRVSRYARVLSGQHQMTAGILADEFLQKAKARAAATKPGDPPPVARMSTLNNAVYPFWDGYDHVVIETIVVTGLSEDERVLRTIDYVKPRTVADMLFTMELFRNNTPGERKEMTKMLASAIDLLWQRTDTQGYKTHPEVVGFLERHKRLLKCVEHMFIENSAKGTDNARKISKLRISAGHAAAICFIQGSSGPKTDGDNYRWGSPPSEKGLDWSLWDKACDFWTLLAGAREFIPVRTALGRLVDSGTPDNQGMGGRTPEKLAIIAKAWEMYKEGEEFMDTDIAPGGPLCLSYSDLDDKGNKLPDGQIKLLDIADFYGIDSPEVVKKSPNRNAEPAPLAPTKEEIERGKEEAQLRRQQAQKK